MYHLIHFPKSTEYYHKRKRRVKMKRSASMFLVVLMLLCLLAPTAMAAPKEDLIIVMPEDLTSFDPLGGTGVPTQNIIRMIYTRLYIDSDDGSMDPVACLAKDLYAVSDNEIDVKIYTGWKNMGKNEGEKTAHWSYFGPNGWLRTGWQQMGKGTNNPDGNAKKHWSYLYRMKNQ